MIDPMVALVKIFVQEDPEKQENRRVMLTNKIQSNHNAIMRSKQRGSRLPNGQPSNWAVFVSKEFWFLLGKNYSTEQILSKNLFMNWKKLGDSCYRKRSQLGHLCQAEMLLRLKERNKLLGRVAGELVLKEVEGGDAKKIKMPDFLIRMDDFWKDFTVILYQDGMGRGVAHARGDMRDTASGHTH